MFDIFCLKSGEGEASGGQSLGNEQILQTHPPKAPSDNWSFEWSQTRLLFGGRTCIQWALSAISVGVWPH